MRLIKNSALKIWIIFSTLSFTLATHTLNAQSTSSASNSVEIISKIEKSKPELAKELKAIHSATKKYEDINVALAEGYIRDPFNICDTAPMMGQPAFMGAMGVHYVRPDLLGLTGSEPRVNGNGLHTDFLKPGILIYEPMEDGSQKLVAIENLVFQKGWHEAGNQEPPSFLGHGYFPMSDNPNTEADEAHKFEPHYDLHMWLYKENPHGLFTPFNPSVSCEFHDDETGK